MDVFISWSGERSKGLALALRNWLPKIINALQPWLSSADIDKGARWGSDIAAKLESAKVGIICLTPTNIHSDWILFEAGALSKTLQNTYVCPLLLDLEPSDVRGPLAQFQATRANKQEVKRLVETINASLGDRALQAAHVDEAFEVWWPRLESQITALPADESAKAPGRSERDILEEILSLVRQNSREQAAPGAKLPSSPKPTGSFESSRSLGSFERWILESVAADADERGIPKRLFQVTRAGSHLIALEAEGAPPLMLSPSMPAALVREAVRQKVLESAAHALPRTPVENS